MCVNYCIEYILNLELVIIDWNIFQNKVKQISYDWIHLFCLTIN